MSDDIVGQRICINGWWDFLPVDGDPEDGSIDPQAVPEDGWLPRAVLVPGWWTKPRVAVRRPGELHYRSCSASPVAAGDGGVGQSSAPAPGDQTLFDGFGYPDGWAVRRAGWLRRMVTADAAQPGRRRLLLLEGLTPRGWIFVNGAKVGSHDDPSMPLQLDIEDALRPGSNEIAVRIADFRHEGETSYPGRGHRTLVPMGNAVTDANSGLWQDAWLVSRGEVRVEHVAVRTMVRAGRLWASWTVRNAGAVERHVTLAADVVPWARHQDLAASTALTSFSPQQVLVAAGASVEVEAEIAWADAPQWTPERPELLVLRTRIDNCPGELHGQRFGFREVWIDGPHLMLNDHPVHLGTEWGHRFHPGQFTEAFVRQWLGMLRDANLNHLRLFSLPNPPLILDLADELGFLVTAETALNGAGGNMAADLPEFWVAAQAHGRRLIARDGNRPSVILWSTGNEVRWNQDRTDLTVRELPRLRLLMQQLDPTRPVYHDGDSSLWPEGGHGPSDQRLISRHYGKETSGLGWWDKAKPLHSGEVGVWHYMGPNNVMHLAGDRAWADYAAGEAAGDRDAVLTIEAGRSNGVTAFGPWNISGLLNLRDHGEVRLDYADWESPGIKPLVVHAHASEFRFWEGGRGYTPTASFARIARAFRPLALIDRGMRRAWMAGSRIVRTLHVVNDTAGQIAGELNWRISLEGRTIAECNEAVTVGRGRVGEVIVGCGLPAGLTGRVSCQAELRIDGVIRDGWTRAWWIAAPRRRTSGTVAVWGDGSATAALAAVGAQGQQLSSLSALASCGARLLVVERAALHTGDDLTAIRDFAASGGRVLFLEQEHGPFPGHALEPRPVSTSFIRHAGHPVFAGLGEDDLAFWGDDAFARFPADTTVARKLYGKGDGRCLDILADSGEGSFGDGHLAGVLVSGRVGAGLVIGSQYLLTDATTEHPGAAALLANLLDWMDTWCVPAARQLMETTDVQAGVAAARTGATVLVGPLNPAGLATWAAATGVALNPLRLDALHQMVKTGDDALHAGISDEDPCGIEAWTYCPPVKRDVALGELCLQPGAGLEALWVTPTASCLAEMFVHGGRAEAMRAHARTRFLGAERPLEAVVIGRIRCGAGQIIVSQYAPPQDADSAVACQRFARLPNRLRANLGAAVPDALGSTVPPGSERSAGHPRGVLVREGPLDDAAVADLLGACVFNPERMLTRAVTRLGAWMTCAAVDGVCTMTPGAERWLYLVIDSPTLRRTVDTNLGVPNPGTLTFCDVTAAGAVRLAVNGRWYPEVTCVAGRATIADLALEQGFNHLLIRWTAGDGCIGLHFRNIVREPETGFAFP